MDAPICIRNLEFIYNWFRKRGCWNRISYIDDPKFPAAATAQLCIAGCCWRVITTDILICLPWSRSLSFSFFVLPSFLLPHPRCYHITEMVEITLYGLALKESAHFWPMTAQSFYNFNYLQKLSYTGKYRRISAIFRAKFGSKFGAKFNLLDGRGY